MCDIISKIFSETILSPLSTAKTESAVSPATAKTSISGYFASSKGTIATRYLAKTAEHAEKHSKVSNAIVTRQNSTEACVNTKSIFVRARPVAPTEFAINTETLGNVSVKRDFLGKRASMKSMNVSRYRV